MTFGGYEEHAKISGIRYENPDLSINNAIVFSPQEFWTPIIDSDNIAYQSMFKPFNVNQYLYPRPPIDMGYMDTKFECSYNVLRMPLKFPNTSYKIPYELKNLVP